MKFSESLPENVKIACASLLGMDEIPLTEIQYYHHLRENPRMQSASLFILNETPYGTSVGCYDIDVAKRLMSAMPIDSPILSETNRRRFCQLLEEKIQIRSLSYGRFFCTDIRSFRKVLPPEGYQVKRLSPNELVGVLVPKYKTYGILVDGEIVSRGSMAEFVDDVYPISRIVSVYTIPSYRQRGLGKATVSACTLDALSREKIPIYSAEVENVASLRTCMAVGYYPYGESLEIFGQISVKKVVQDVSAAAINKA